MKYCDMTTEEKGIIAEMYISGLSIDKIANKTHCAKSAIYKTLDLYDIKRRDRSHMGRKYDIDEEYFDSINTSNKAYIMGLLYSDGCNYPPQHRVKLELQENDMDILQKINIELKHTKPLAFNNLHSKNERWQNTYRIDITNVHISDQLATLGMVQNKSLILKPPVWLNDELFSHFLRGYVDGDGCIHESCVQIATTYEMCVYFQKQCENKLNVTATISDICNNPNSNTKIFRVGKRSQMKTFLDYIYCDAELYIQRKFDKYLSLFSY